MARVLVLFYSRTGDTARLAEAIVEGVRSVRFAEVDVRRLEPSGAAEEIARDPQRRDALERLRGQYRTLDDAADVAEYDAIVLGGPTRDGVMAEEVTRALDRLGALHDGRALVDKVGSVFAPRAAAGDGHERALASLLAPMYARGMILASPGPAAPDADELAIARQQGARAAKVAEWVRHAKGHEHGAGQGHHHHH